MTAHRITFPTIGMPNVAIRMPNGEHFRWKRRLKEYAIAHPCLVTLQIDDLCCDWLRRTHCEFLEMFDAGDSDYEKSNYFRYKRDRMGEDRLVMRIERFRDLYNKIRRGLYFGFPVITDDGWRVDGSHRISIYGHLQFDELEVGLVRYEDVFDADQAKRMRAAFSKFRRSTRSLPEKLELARQMTGGVIR